jgi:hypothetical protein
MEGNMGIAAMGRRAERKSLLFCEQKISKKTFVIYTMQVSPARAQANKSFLLLFFKKEVLASFPCTPPPFSI